jgi:GGDEF domain-containing protein
MTKKTFVIALSLMVIPAIGLLDQASGDDLSLITLYLVPIALTSWQGGLGWGAAAAALSMASWLVANVAFPIQVDIDPSFGKAWDIAEKLVFFSLTVAAMVRIRSLVLAEKRKGMTDYATGLPNTRAFARDLAAAKAAGGEIDIGFIDLDGVEELYLERGESYIEALLKSVAELAATAAKTYRLGDERLAIISIGMTGDRAAESMRGLARDIEERILEPRGLGSISPKIGIAHCVDSGPISVPALRRFLEGSMIYLRGMGGRRVEVFEFVKP